MAPDRGSAKNQATNSGQPHSGYGSFEGVDNDSADGDSQQDMDPTTSRGQSETNILHAEKADQDQNFTIRGTVVGLAIGVIICFSNTYFGLQTGWVSGMAMPSALIGFAFFKSVARYIDYPFTPVENVLVTTVAGAVGTMPLGCGFVGVMPALNYLLTSEENGPLVLGLGKLIIWAVGICFFGVVFAVPLRKEVIIREKLKFPSGTATALIIGVLHGNADGNESETKKDCLDIFKIRSHDMLGSPTLSGKSPAICDDGPRPRISRSSHEPESQEPEIDHKSDWKSKIKSLLIAFAASASYVRHDFHSFFFF